MAATLKRLVYKERLEKGDSNFTSASGNVAVLSFETEDRSLQWLVLLSDTAVTPAHFNNWDDGEDLPIGTLLIDRATPMVYMLTATDTWQEIGDIT